MSTVDFPIANVITEYDVLNSYGWFSSFSNNLDGHYGYHAYNSWILLATDDSYSIVMKMWYIDIENTAICMADVLLVR